MDSHFLISDAKNFFYNQHDVECNQKYIKEYNIPYSYHLESVKKEIDKWVKLVPERNEKLFLKNYFVEITYKDIVYVAGYGHDSIEDARLTYNDIKEKFGIVVADIIILCTEFSRGKNRDERKPKQFYEELKTNKFAVFIKLCDIISNTKFSLYNNSSMYEKYKKEYNDKVRPHLYCEEYKEMFMYMDKLYNL
jgi:(p)ppGpp synthase/HD superfamily hydrolase